MKKTNVWPSDVHMTSVVLPSGAKQSEKINQIILPKVAAERGYSRICCDGTIVQQKKDHHNICEKSRYK